MFAAKLVAPLAAAGAGAYFLSKKTETPAALSRSRASVLAAGGAGPQVFDLQYYLKAALAGGICCGVTHGAMTVRRPPGSKCAGNLCGASLLAVAAGCAANASPAPAYPSPQLARPRPTSALAACCSPWTW